MLKRTYLATLLLATLLLATLVSFPAGAQGFEGWRFGMTLDQVKAVPGCAQYKPLKSTGGLECADYAYVGEKGFLSFVFKDGKLAKIQVWAYEGSTLLGQSTRWQEVLRHLEKKYGAIESPQLKEPAKMSAAQLFKALEALGARGKIQFKPANNPADAFVFGSAIVDPRGKYVFVYFQPPK